MSAEKLTVIFTPAISGRDYLAKSAEKANAWGLTINVGEGPNNRRVWFMRFLFWLPPTAPPNPISALLLVSGNEPQAICAIPCSSFSYPPWKRPLVCYANSSLEFPSMGAFFRCPRADTPVVPRNPFRSCELPCDSFRSIDTTNGCQCRENGSPE